MSFMSSTYFWYNRPATDTTRSYEGLWTLVHDWVRRKKETKNRKEALKDHLPGIVHHDAKPKGNGKGKGQGQKRQSTSLFRVA